MSAFDGGYLSIPGLVIAENALILHPGRHRIAYDCPLPTNALRASHDVPAVEFDFVAGQRYELQCKDGNPAIRIAPGE